MWRDKGSTAREPYLDGWSYARLHFLYPVLSIASYLISLSQQLG